MSPCVGDGAITYSAAPTPAEPTLFGTRDLQRLDRELDHFRELGLFGFGLGGGVNLEDGQTDLTPSPLAMHLYVRAQGSRLSPVAYWNLTLPPLES